MTIPSLFRLGLLILSGAIGLYMILIIIRLLLTWFPMPHTEPAARFLHRIVGPWLNLIARIFPIRLRFIDLSPIIALAILGFLFSITGTLARQGTLTWGFLAGTLIGYLWYIIAFILDLLAALCLIRLISFSIGTLRNSPYLESLDEYLYRVVTPLSRFFNRRTVPYRMLLLVSGITILSVRIAGTIGVHILIRWLRNL